MAWYQPFKDVPSIPLNEQGPLYMAYASSPYNETDLEDCWQPMNAANQGTRTVQGIDTHLRNVELHISDIERAANGAGYPPQSQKISRPQFDQPWEPSEPYPYLDRSHRYVSPGGLWGGDISASDMEPSSPPSETSWSPASTQTVNAYPQNQFHWKLFGPPSAEALCHGGMGNFPTGSGSYFGQHLDGLPANGAPVVAMREIQHYPDPEPDVEEDSRAHAIKTEFVSETDQFEVKPSIDDTNFRRLHDEGLGESVMDEDSCRDDGEEDDDDASDYTPRKRPQRRSSYATRHSGHSAPTTRRTRPKRTASGNNYRVEKHTKTTTASGRSQLKSRKSRSSNPPRPFVCSFAQYGCPSTFGSKNEWKRHVSSQHLQLGYYRCDVGQCNPENAKAKSGTPHSRTYNDFNRKDLFTQHQRRMHAPWSQSKTPSQQAKDDFEAGLETVRERCWRENRQAPQQSVCGFCRHLFDGPSSWEERMEHVGKHYEKGEGEEKEDEELREWAVREGLLRQISNGTWRLKGLKDDRDTEVVQHQLDDDEDAEGEEE
jgi:hypothetical protein